MIQTLINSHPWAAWSLLGFVAFQLITLSTGGKVNPILATLLAIAAGPLTWALIIIYLARNGTNSAVRDELAKRAAKAELERDQAIKLLARIMAEHDSHTGDTYLAPHLEREIVAAYGMAYGPKTRKTNPNRAL